MKLIFKISVATLLSLVSTVFVANADAGSDENAQTEQSLKKQELDLKRARLRESLKHDQAHSLQRRALDKQKNQANIDRVDYYNVLRNKSDSVQSETESENLSITFQMMLMSAQKPSRNGLTAICYLILILRFLIKML